MSFPVPFFDMSFDPAQPYNDLPTLPPAVELETRTVLKACVEARAALAELKAAGALIPNQAVLINTIPLLEARASSEIENIVTTSDALFRFAQDEYSADPATKEALNYRAALRLGFESLRERPLGTNTAVAICSRLKGRVMEIRQIPGTQLRNTATREIIYTPPVGEALLRSKLADWERFIHEAADLDPLVRMAVAHYQFEAIHPFLDGNGRTGRVLNLLVLVSEGLLDEPILYLSRAILHRRQEYYRLLLAVTREGAWQEWIVFMLEAVAETARWTTEKIAAIRQQQLEASRFIQERAERIYSRELMDVLFTQPYCRIQNLVDAGIAQRQTASVYLKQLVEVGMLQEVKAGREKLFVHPNFVELLGSDEHEVRPYGT